VTPDGSTWPVGRIRSEIQQLLADVQRWRLHPHREVGQDLRERANRALEHLRRQPGAADRALPADFTFEARELSVGTSVMSKATVDRFEAHLRLLTSLLPDGSAGPRTAISLDGAHPQVHAACGPAWQAGDWAGAIRAARRCVMQRLRDLAELEPDEPVSALSALGTMAPLVWVLDPADPNAERSQIACWHLAEGLFDASTLYLADRHAPTNTRAREVLGVASMVMQLLEFAHHAR
jgi:hypothetical protein